MGEPKKCPFCGGDARYHFNGTEGYVMCDWCGSRGPKLLLTDEICVREKAIEFWNRRNTESAEQN